MKPVPARKDIDIDSDQLDHYQKHPLGVWDSTNYLFNINLITTSGFVGVITLVSDLEPSSDLPSDRLVQPTIIQKDRDKEKY